MTFAEWLLLEAGLSVGAAPGLESRLPEAERALRTYLSRYGGHEFAAAKSRFAYTLDRVREGGWDETIYQFSYLPIESNRRGRPEIAAADDYRRGFDPDWDGRTGARLFPTPKDAIEAIPERDDLGYRGMSWEEWRLTQKRGFVQSAGNYNLSNQGGLTFYGRTPETGAIYASGFAPVVFMVAPKRPGIVIGVPRSHLLDHTRDPGIPGGELAHRGPLPVTEIAEVYMLVATRAKPGWLEIVVRGAKVSEGSRQDARTSYAIRRIQ